MLEKNIATEKIYSMSVRTISTKFFLKIGFVVDSQIQKFEQNVLPNKRSYNLVYVIDISNFVLFDFNRSQTLATIILLLLAPSTTDENEEIFVDIIINTEKKVDIIEYNLECNLHINYYLKEKNL